MAKFLDFGDNVSFKDIPITDDGIPTTEFLKASETLVSLFNILGATTFSVVISDMNGNIKKIRDRQTEAPASSATLQQLTAAEFAEKKNKATATQGLLWLLRGLDFTAQGLRHNIDNPTEELKTSFNHAYGNTLKPHHNFVVKGVFGVAVSAVPGRKDFYDKLGTPDHTGKDDRLIDWLDNLEVVVKILQNYYKENKDFGF
ncbi:hypothetical protein TWF694_011809 [Orbilia ellipsospora]|uniref:Glycolipid transfer protein domain-containing protein n=1 Tax=Orbilia ellipsospora TaxID=2528407 RepID=A0AAV9X6A8_9PEZI